mgnify:CR=1 FL=1
MSKLNRYVFVAFAAFAPAVFAQAPTPRATPPARTNAVKAPPMVPVNKTQLSYALGYQVGNRLAVWKKVFGEQVDLRRVIRGLEDAYARKKPTVAIRDMRNQLVSLQGRIRKESEARFRRLAATNLQKSDAFLATNKSKPGIVTLPNGIQYRVLERGTGHVHPTLDSKVTMHYRISLTGGREIASSYAKGKPITIEVKKALSAWKEVLPRMVVGARWQIYAPPKFAFGLRGLPPDVGPDVAVKFDIKLLRIDNQ